MRWGIAFVLLCALARPAVAQRAPQTAFESDGAVPTSIQGVAFVASAVLPGSGQFYLKSDKWVPFLAVEAWAWVKYLQARKRGDELERNYRDLAWNVARRITTAERRDSAFTYYEAMADARWRTSGLFDADPVAPGLQPEGNEETFNGEQWRRARALFLRGVPATPGTPEFESALSYYRLHAIPDAYLWNWGNSRLEQQAFTETISESDAAFRRGTTMLGVILANHVVSAVDALVMARVRLLDEHRIRVGSSVEPDGSSYLWTTTVRIPLNGAERAGNTRTNR